MDKVFCIGFPKTGTTSLESALEQLGYKVCRGNGRNNYSNYLMALYVNRDFAEIFKLVNYFDAFADLPWGGSDLYRQLAHKYPNAKFILSTRDGDSWYRSVLNTALQVDTNPTTALDTLHEMGSYGAVYFISQEWGVDSLAGSRERLIEYYNRHNEAVIEYFIDDPRLLIRDVTANIGWHELCRFLGKNEPLSGFPHQNKGDYNCE